MATVVKCPNPKCGKQLSIPPELAGKKVKCNTCGQSFLLPGPPPPAPDAGTVLLGSKPRVAQPPSAVPAPQPPVQSAIPNPQSAMQQDPLIGAKIAHYRIQAVLGEGGMGKVYKAHNTSLDKTCAIKILPQEFAKQDQTHIDRFVREARSAAKVEHGNVLPVSFVGKVAEHYFIEMQYVDGGTLQGVLKQKGKLEVKEAAQIIRDVAAGLQAAHEKGIIHRDIKPTNVMLTAKGHVYVMDFGLAKVAEARTALTQQGYILGTPLYMSPEQAMSQPVDHRSDIYSLGVVFYQLLTGTPPYTSNSPVSLLYMHQHAPIPDIHQVAPDIPLHIAEMIRKMMAKDRAERYQSCAEIVQELNGFLTTGGATVTVSEEALRDAPDHRKSILSRAKRGAPARPPGAPPKKRLAMPVTLVLVLLLVLVLGAGAYFVLKNKRSGFGVQGSGTAQLETPNLQPQTAPSKSGWDDAYLTTAATGDSPRGEAGKIPHPLSRKTYKQTLADGTTVDAPEGMVYIPAGEFTMGKGGSQHRVYLDAYFIGKYEVTNAEWQAFCNFTGFAPLPDHWKGGRIPDGKENHPVVNVSWEDIQKYCDWVSRETGRRVTLPTEAQWEKAAAWDPKTNHRNEYPWGDDFDPGKANHCWQLGFRQDKGAAALLLKWDQSDEGRKISSLGGNTASVGQFRGDVSAYGCFDMGGNVAEWVGDWFCTDYYRNGVWRNPTGPTKEQAENILFAQKEYGPCRVCRGGYWRWPRDRMQTSFRNWYPAVRYTTIGFRCAIDCPPHESEAQPSPATVESPWDDAYVTTAATGEKIPHPLSRKTRTEALPSGKAVTVPEGMVYIPAGEFTMGEKESEHKVYLDAYFIGKYEVTNAEWEVFCNFTGFTPLPQHWKNGKIPEGKENHPVLYVSWDDAQKYCEWVTRMTRSEVRLPTEAQWEKAARGPKGFTYPWGNDWSSENCNWQGLCASQYGLTVNADGSVPGWAAFTKSEKWKVLQASGGFTTPVGSFPKGQSSYGCHDMAGNVYEWCLDWYAKEYYRLQGANHNPEGPSEEQAPDGVYGSVRGKARVWRGGAWEVRPSGCRSANRDGRTPKVNGLLYGFRVAARPAP